MRITKRRATILLFLTLAAITVAGGGGVFMWNLLRDEVFKPREGVRPLDLEVMELGEDRITLGVVPEVETYAQVRDEWKKSGLWGLRWDEGYAQVGEILKLDERQVVREFSPISGDLKAGDRVRTELWPYADDPSRVFGLNTRKVSFSSPLGEFPAYLIDGTSRTWVIFVHGKLPPRKGPIAYPILPVVAELGLPSLIISYRNDVGELPNPDGFHWYGLTEWEDLEGAVGYAQEQGAESVILVGYSMGGAIVTNFLYRSPLAAKVSGAILDAPMLDLSAVITHGVRERGLPTFLTEMGKLLAGVRFGVDWKALNYLSRADQLTLPILLFHGDADAVVPVETSDALAEARPDVVDYHRVSDATHVRSWNMNPDRYEGTVREFLRGLADLPPL